MADPFTPGRPGAPQPSQPGGAQGTGGDPSMEDILASIRRILNEEEPAGPSDPPPPAGDEPLDLTREMLVGGPQTPAGPPARPPAESKPPQAAAPPAPAEPPPDPDPEPAAQPAPPTAAADALLAPAVAAAASASLGHLLRTVAAERGSAVARSGGPTIEDVVREELRPLLKEWLDQHLPGVVERLVRVEIERVVGRALS
jgi:cell pole-organizing protein PopZ